MRISVIIPCHNAGDALTACAGSLFDAALPGETQLVFIDDASTDGAMEKLAGKYRDRENIVFLRHDQRRGVSASRNAGLTAAQGEFIAFCDADDYVEKDFFMKLLTAIEKNNADLAACAICRENSEKNELWQLPATNFARELIAHAMPSPEFNSVCNKLYRKDKIDALQLRFDECSCAMEDLLFNVRYLLDSQNVAIISDAFYHYRAHPFSATARETAAKAHSSVAATREVAGLLIGKDVATARCRVLVDALMTTLRADGFRAADTCTILEELPEKFWRDGRFGFLKRSILRLAAYTPHLARFFVRGSYALRRLFCGAAD